MKLCEWNKLAKPGNFNLLFLCRAIKNPKQSIGIQLVVAVKDLIKSIRGSGDSTGVHGPSRFLPGPQVGPYSLLFLPIVPLMEHIFVLKFLVFTQNLEVWFQCRFIPLPLLLSSKYIFVWKSVNTCLLSTSNIFEKNYLQLLPSICDFGVVVC